MSRRVELCGMRGGVHKPSQTEIDRVTRGNAMTSDHGRLTAPAPRRRSITYTWHDLQNLAMTDARVWPRDVREVVRHVDGSLTIVVETEEA